MAGDYPPPTSNLATIYKLWPNRTFQQLINSVMFENSFNIVQNVFQAVQWNALKSSIHSIPMYEQIFEVTYVH